MNARPAQKALHREVKCLITIAVGILFVLSAFAPGTIGFVGRFFETLFFGLFGFGAYFLPLGVIAVAIAALVYRQLRLPYGLIIALIWLVLSLLHIINAPGFDELGFFARLREVFLDGGRFTGGFFGALVGELLFTFLGNIGSIVAIGAGILVITVLLTGRSFVYWVARGANAVGSAASRAKDHYTRLPDAYGEYEAYEEYDDEYGDNEERPLPERRKLLKSNKAKLIDVEEGYDDRAYTLPPVRLVHEEMDQKSERPMPIHGTGPLFARRSVDRVVAFPDQEEPVIETEEGPYYAEEPVVKGLIEEEYIPDEYIPPAPINQAYFEDNPSNTAGASSPSLASSVAPPISDEKIVSFPSSPSSPPAAHTPQPPSPVIRSRQPQQGAVISYESAPSYDDFQLPPLHLLKEPPIQKSMAESRTQILENSRILEETLRSFRIEAKVVEVSVGPTVTRYDLAPGPGVKVSSIANLSNDLALSLAAQGIRIEAPIPGKSAVGIEIPNKEPQPVYLREIIQEEGFNNFQSKLAFAVGKDIAGEPVVTDIGRMPHLLIAGATGSGKSVCINTLIASLLYKARPDEVKLLMIDPKVVELSVYNGIPHLLIPVVTDPKKASGALSWAVSEMESRYNMFAETGCRDLKGFNLVKSKANEQELPQIVIIIDELADLMMACKGEVEESICRLAQKARAAGIHLIVATQRPSVDVITGLIKANIPSRLAFAVSSGTDSRTVLDMYGAEKLLGKGDMLFLPMGNNKPVRIQGGFISDGEVESLVNFLKAQAPAEYTTEMIQQVTMPGKANIEGEVDEFFHDAVDFLLTKGKASTSMLQRQFRIGYNRASRLMDELEARGIVGPEDGVKPRKVTITREEYQEIYG
ncbi:MAG: DNA translocase FtsK [Defluviitaleaceae bacterium]|nr:DNA translocase FtsK [Defluviitaleaceae bacterium]